jgi:hypothetical protein
VRSTKAKSALGVLRSRSGGLPAESILLCGSQLIKDRIGTVGDVSLVYDKHGVALTTTTRNSDSSLTIDHRGLNRDGSVADDNVARVRLMYG